MKNDKKKNTKQLLIVSSLLIVIGIALTITGIMLGGFPGVKITKDGISSTAIAEQEILPKTKLDDVSRLDIQLDSNAASADFVIKPSGDEHFYLEYALDAGFDELEYEVEGQTLTLSRKPLNSIMVVNLSFFVHSREKNKITLYVPQDADFDDISIRHAGELSILGLSLSAKNMLLENSDGKMELKGLDTDMLTLEMDGGKITAANLETDGLSIFNSYGSCDITSLSCENAKFTLDNSSLNLGAKSLGALDCTAEYGDVSLTLPDASDMYDYEIDVDYGTLTLFGDELPPDDDDSSHTRYHAASGKADTITIRAEDGNVDIKEH